jgi:hypothetical protein
VGVEELLTRERQGMMIAVETEQSRILIYEVLAGATLGVRERKSKLHSQRFEVQEEHSD